MSHIHPNIFSFDIITAYKLQFQKHSFNTIGKGHNRKINPRETTIHLSSCYWHCYNSSLTISSISFTNIFLTYASSLSPMFHWTVSLSPPKKWNFNFQKCSQLLFMFVISSTQIWQIDSISIEWIYVCEFLRNKFSICVNKLQCEWVRACGA